MYGSFGLAAQNNYMNHKIGIILRLVMTNHINIVGTSISIVAKVKYFFLRTHSIKSVVVGFFS